MKNTIQTATATHKTAKVLKKLRIYKSLYWVLPLLALALAVLSIMDLLDPEFTGYRWCIYLELASVVAMIGISIFELYRCGHATGDYRCKVCGRIHTPNEEALAEMLTDAINYSYLHCEACGKRTRHYKLHTGENP